MPIDFIILKLGLCPLERDAKWPGKDLSALRKKGLGGETGGKETTGET